MFFSRNNFFQQSESALSERRIDVHRLLYFKGIDSTNYLSAYDYFCKNKKEFDGATLVKDLNDIPELDLNAMLHDYRYLTDFGVIKKFTWDYEYFQGMNDLGKGYRLGRYIGLLLSSIFFIPYKLIKKLNK
jgi:hypothetical protein